MPSPTDGSCAGQRSLSQWPGTPPLSAQPRDYTERQPSRLIDNDTQHGTELLTTLRHYLEAAGNKTIAARGGPSRETMYQRLPTVERLLYCNLESGIQRTELHVALTALGVLRTR